MTNENPYRDAVEEAEYWLAVQQAKNEGMKMNSKFKDSVIAQAKLKQTDRAIETIQQALTLAAHLHDNRAELQGLVSAGGELKVAESEYKNIPYETALHTEYATASYNYGHAKNVLYTHAANTRPTLGKMMEIMG